MPTRTNARTRATHTPPDLTGVPLGYLHLQGIGECHAIPARHLKPGMILSWNYSPACSVVVEFSPVSACFGLLTERSRETGAIHQRRLKLDRLVAVSYSRTEEL